MTQIGKEKTARTFGELKSIIADIPDDAKIGTNGLCPGVSLTKWKLNKADDSSEYEDEVLFAKEENQKPNLIRFVLDRI